MFSPDSKFDECFERFVVECEFVENSCSTTDFICTESADKPVLFLKFNLSRKLGLQLYMNEQHSNFSVMCYTVVYTDFIDYSQ